MILKMKVFITLLFSKLCYSQVIGEPAFNPDYYDSHPFYSGLDLDRLPVEIVDELANCALAAAEFTAQERFGQKWR